LSAHDAAQPSSTCRGCGDPWPCVSRRRQLLAEYDGAPVSLTVYMTGQFVVACADLPNALVGELSARFIGWIPRGRHEAPP